MCGARIFSIPQRYWNAGGTKGLWAVACTNLFQEAMSTRERRNSSCPNGYTFKLVRCINLTGKNRVAI